MRLLRTVTGLVGLALLGSGCARRPMAPAFEVQRGPSFDGPDTTEVDLIRPGPGAPRVFVYATLPDGEPGLFQIDTGASLSVLSAQVADRLGLQVRDTGGFVEGLSGRAPLREAVLPAITIGDMVIPDVEVAVDVPGVPDRAGAMRMDGILGNNVWSRFVLEIDYPADVLALHRPGTVRLPRRATPMFFDGSHVLAPIEVTAASDPPLTSSVFVQIDTGAGELLLVRDTGRAFATAATEGIESVYGIGASETLPPTQFLRTTRRIPLSTVEIGGRTVEAPFDAMWIGFSPGESVSPSGIKGLAGHELLAGHRAFFAYQEGLFALDRSPRKKRQLDGHRVALDQDIARYGTDAPERGLYRAELHAALGDLASAERLLRDLLATPEADPEDIAQGRVMLASILRVHGDLAGAYDVLAALGPAELVDQGQIIATVNGLLLDGRLDEALSLAKDAAVARPESGDALVAQADVLVAMGELEAADLLLLDAARLVHNPDAHLLRRARIALAAGDPLGATAQIRRLLELYPSEGLYLWFYALLLVEDDVAADLPAAMTATFRQDLMTAMGRLHPDHRPFDFLVAAHRALGDTEEAVALMDQGIARDCADTTDAPLQDNCLAWYWSLAGVHTDDALARIEAALEATGARSDFLDTKAMVHLSRGELDAAAEAAVAAARLAPDDIYMLWQAERLQAMAAAR